MTLSCLVWSLTQTHLAASLLPSVIDMHTTVYTHTLLGTHTLTRIGSTEKLSGLLCSHARLLADRDKPLFHSLTHPHRYTHTCKHLASPSSPMHRFLWNCTVCRHIHTRALAHNEYVYKVHSILNTGCLNTGLFCYVPVYDINDWRCPLHSSLQESKSHSLSALSHDVMLLCSWKSCTILPANCPFSDVRHIFLYICN